MLVVSISEEEIPIGVIKEPAGGMIASIRDVGLGDGFGIAKDGWASASLVLLDSNKSNATGDSF